MNAIELLIKGIEFARARTLGFLDGIEKEPDPQALLAWRPGPGRAHVGWQLMHIAVTEEIFATERLAHQKESQWKELLPRFRGGSTPDDDVPSVVMIREVLTGTREHLLGTLRTIGEDRIDEIPEALRERKFTFRDVFFLIAWHEGHHQGQAQLDREPLQGQPLKNQAMTRHCFFLVCASITVAWYSIVSADDATITIKGIVLNEVHTGEREQSVFVYALDGTPEIRAEVEKLVAEYYPDKGLDAEAARKLQDQFTAKLKYFIDGAIAGELHQKATYGARQPTALTGTVSEKDGRRWITVGKAADTTLHYPAKMLAPTSRGSCRTVHRLWSASTIGCRCDASGWRRASFSWASPITSVRTGRRIRPTW